MCGLTAPMDSWGYDKMCVLYNLLARMTSVAYGVQSFE